MSGEKASVTIFHGMTLKICVLLRMAILLYILCGRADGNDGPYLKSFGLQFEAAVYYSVKEVLLRDDCSSKLEWGGEVKQDTEKS